MVENKILRAIEVVLFDFSERGFELLDPDDYYDMCKKFNVKRGELGEVKVDDVLNAHEVKVVLTSMVTEILENLARASETIEDEERDATVKDDEDWCG
jgi:hypothetical protein